MVAAGGRLQQGERSDATGFGGDSKDDGEELEVRRLSLQNYGATLSTSRQEL